MTRHRPGLLVLCTLGYDERVLELNRPPAMRMLLKDEAYRGMMRRRPRIPDNCTLEMLSPAWQVWVLTTADRWRRGEFRDYGDAFRVMRDKLKDDTTQDVTIVSKRFLMPPPIGFKWSWRKYPWCPRCRRPSTFNLHYSHRNLKGVELTFDEPNRCFYCGIRQAAFPRYFPR